MKFITFVHFTDICKQTNRHGTNKFCTVLKVFTKELRVDHLFYRLKTRFLLCFNLSLVIVHYAKLLSHYIFYSEGEAVKRGRIINPQANNEMLLSILTQCG